MTARKPVPRRRFAVVGIGASAGGLEATARLLAALPGNTGLAFVVIQHLDPDHESLLTRILQKSTAMGVAQAEDGMAIAPNHVYIIPPGVYMSLRDGCLRLVPRPSGPQAASVDFFLTSLAQERGVDAIAVILSGTASDGSVGIKAIKAEGGIVFAQDETTAAQPGMPRSARATGAVDFVLPPEGIAAELQRLAPHPLSGRDASKIFSDTKSLRRIFESLRRATGVNFALYKPATIQRRVLRRMGVQKIGRLDEYAKKVEKDLDEARALHDDLLIHVTQFFREPAQHAILRAKAFPRMLKALPVDSPIRIWVPGCSTGEEPYSLAITLLDFLSERDSMNPVQIFATDISEPALERARAGLYTEEAVRNVPPRLARRFFTKTGKGYEIAKRVRDLCIFARHDLTKDPPFANLDLISCCNVLIYLDAAAQQQVMPMFHYALKATGALLLSNSETVGAFSGLFSQADKKCRVFFKKPALSNIHFTPSSPRLPTPRAAPAAAKAASDALRGTDVQKVAERILLARFAPSGVIVNEELDILHFRGKVNRYLEPATGRASLTLLKMLPSHTTGPIKGLIQKARKIEGPALASGLEIGGEGVPSQRVDLEVIPFHLPLTGERYYIVLFEDEAGRPPAAKGSRRKAAALPTREEPSLKRIRSELASTRTYLQTVVEDHEAATEELKSANEEIVSSNEELQSTNEELEIAKEELQAANEELSTLNEELQNRNTELGTLNNDLSNLLASVHLPILMVSTDMRIRRVTPTAEKLMNLIPNDIGRPIGDVKPKIHLPNIEEIIQDVVESMVPKELETRDGEGRRFVVRVRPYKTTDNKIEGAVIVFMPDVPITRGSALTDDVSAFEAALELIREPMAILDAAMRVKAATRSMYEAFGLTESQLGRSLFEIENKRWNVAALRERLERLTADGRPINGLRVQVGERDLTFNARRVLGAAGGQPLILLGIDATPPVAEIVP